MSKHGIIVSGGELEEVFALTIFEQMQGACVIGVDKGVRFLYEHKILPDYIVGDFDSLDREIVEYYKNKTCVPIREFDPVKDASDTQIALSLGIELGCEKLVILGATGGRLDHLWGNVQSLVIALKAGVEAQILDPQNKIRLINGRTCLTKEQAYGKYFSVFPLGGCIPKFQITGAKYPLCDHTLTPYDSLCVSNQIGEGETVIDFPEGIVILMETRDKEGR